MSDAGAHIDLAREPEFALASVRVHPATLEVLGSAGREVLEPRVMQVLVALARSADDVVSREALNALCWRGRVVGNDAIARCISRLRRLSEAFGGFQIETVPRVGYRLNATRVALPASASATNGKPSIAVLPFANLSAEPGQDYFADGMVEEISTALTRFPSLVVIAGGSSLSLKGQRLTPQEFGGRLGVRYLLDGSVRKASGRVRISVTLIDARTGVQLWADRFDGDLSDILRLQDEVALSAAARIEPRVEAEEARRAEAKPVADLDAYDLFLRAKALMRSPSSFQQARPLLEQCLALAPGDARALVTSAACLSFLVAFGCADEAELRVLARERAQAAVQLAPEDAEVLGRAAIVHIDLQEDIAAARALADRAVAANPGNAVSWGASGCARLFTDPDVAVEHLEHCLKLDPLSPYQAGKLTALGLARMAQGRLEDAMLVFRQSARLSPDYATNDLMLAICHANAGQLPEARDAAARFRATSGRDVGEHAKRLGASDWFMSQVARIDPET